MKSLRSAFYSPGFHIAALMIAYLASFMMTDVHPMDDHFLYQKFIEALAEGRVDFSIPGFHGSSFLALPIYLVTQSDLSNIYFQILCALLIIPASYCAAISLVEDKKVALLFMYAVALSPLFFFVAFRGFTFPSYTLLLLLSLALYGRGSRWTWLPLGISFIIKPFSIALAPLFLFWKPKKQKLFSIGWKQLAIALIIPTLYLLFEYAQIGRIIVGAHEEINQSNVFVWWRAPLNWAHGIQMLFSVHNFYFPNPVDTRMWNMVHMSPVLMMLGVLSYLHPKEFWKDRTLAFALLLSCIAAFLLAGLLDHMDQFYIETAVILLGFAGSVALIRYPLLIPVVLITFHFQWMYTYLELQDAFHLHAGFFTILLLADIFFCLLCLSEWKTIEKIVRSFLR